jgi:hypothetical protein
MLAAVTIVQTDQSQNCSGCRRCAFMILTLTLKSTLSLNSALADLSEALLGNLLAKVVFIFYV